MKLIKTLSIILLLLVIPSCTRVYVPTQPSQTYYGNGSNVTQVARDTIEFRVTGNADSVKVRYDNGTDGLVQLNTTLPYVVDFPNIKDNVFLSLEATPVSYSSATYSPFLSIQIYINGVLFREATSSNIFTQTLSVNGTYRRQ